MLWPWIAAFILFVGVLFILPLRSREPEFLTDKTRQNAPGQFVRLSMGLVHYEMTGQEEGPVIVLVHGFSVPGYVWNNTGPALVASGFRVIRYDLYGRGWTERPNVVYDRHLFVDQLAELLDALRLGPTVHLVGYSMGGAIVAAFVSAHPERIAKVVLIDPFCERKDIGVLRVPHLGEYLAYAFYVPSMPAAQKRDLHHPAFPEWDELFRTQMRFAGFRRAILSTLRHVIDCDPTKDYEALGTGGKPTLLIWGKEDRTLPLSGAYKLRDLLSPEFLWVEQAAHLPHYEHPEVVNPRLIRFLLHSPAKGSNQN